jgi:hypothetical protein
VVGLQADILSLGFGFYLKNRCGMIMYMSWLGRAVSDKTPAHGLVFFLVLWHCSADIVRKQGQACIRC